MAPREPLAQLCSAPKTPRRQCLCQPRVSSPDGSAACFGSASPSWGTSIVRRRCSLVSSPFHFAVDQPAYDGSASPSSAFCRLRDSPAASRASSACEAAHTLQQSDGRVRAPFARLEPGFAGGSARSPRAARKRTASNRSGAADHDLVWVQPAVAAHLILEPACLGLHHLHHL
eukprot:6047023-Prymnesium_polylepis.1